jgi:hypothetical protein
VELTVGSAHGYPAGLVGRYNDNTDILPKGVGVYIGTSYHFVIDKVSLLYGVGYRF